MSEPREQNLSRESQDWFEAHLEKLRNDKRWIEVPGLEHSSMPEDVVFFDDLSDRDQFNGRYIESRVRLGAMRSVAKLMTGIFIVLLIVVVGDLFDKGIYIDDWGRWIMISALAIYGFFVWLCLKDGYPNIVRFNRQAQMVHVILVSSSKVESIPWRDVKPFLHFQRDLWGSYNLELLFPYRQPTGRKRTRNFPLRVTGGFDGKDWVAAYTAINRWEFIRLYMEKGLEAIPIHEEARRKGALTKPSGNPRNDEPDFDKDPISYIWRVWLNRLLVFPYVIDRIMERRETNFRWPEEVEKLCEEGADLSGIDTRPVVARTDEYYYVTPIGAPRFGTREELRQFRIVELRQQGLDPDGNPIPGFAEEQRKQAERERAAKEAQRQSEREALASERAARRNRSAQTGKTDKPRGGASWTPPGK